MENHPNCILDWPSFCREKGIEELTESLWLTKMELEATRARIEEQNRVKDDQLDQLRYLLNHAIKERNEARNKLLLQQQFHHHKTAAPPPHSGVSSVEDEAITNYGFSFSFSSSDCEESIVSSPPVEPPAQFPAPAKGLPEKGKFLEAVMKAGPLLNNLLLAGPLPHWRHPPPPLETYQIPSPPWVISSQPLNHLVNVNDSYFEFNKKRGFSEDSDSSTETKYQRISIN
ncbi:hypothetical protein SSX86_018756 [Deinandra increscens subsp. villosa]|uniref:Uncharacterized protein n=1 Tax=Deinandra increscens subsp. villosa TaxID=3103831 RepID=A0AAP0GV14_9ASTR